ncbi:hypothetical protein AArcSt2_12540 [Natronocalculus amylovorans]|uniref:Uncharacterized protein n=1 Tax=Natronocalculus amylovorans TaxID=2917812 RepID=A0AAE3FY96_9EURY|nr:hypothetical protein [Natronocalculus amylovorans]
MEGKVEYWEDEIYDQFEEEREINFVTLIEGNTGTGKSELCAYLSLRLEEEGRPVLYIKKSDGILTIINKRIPQFCENHGKEPPETTAKSRQFEEQIEKLPKTVASQIAGDAISALANYDIKDNVDELSDFIYERLDILLEQSENDEKEDEKESKKMIDEGDYKNNSDIQIFNNEKEWPPIKAIDELNNRIINAIEGKYGVPPIDELLRDVGDKFENTRPVFVIEDVSITGSEADKLTNFMEDKDTKSNWDFILAGTTDSTEEFKSQTSEARFNIYQTTDNIDGNQVPHLTKEDAVQFIRPYLGYIKNHDGSVSYERDEYNKVKSIKDPLQNTICTTCEFCDREFRDLFPFNENFIERLFESLEPPTPRAYIVRVSQILRRWARGDINSPADADVLQNVGFNTRPSEEVRNFSKPLTRSALWYGNVNEDEGFFTVNKKFLDAFNIIDNKWDLNEAPIEVNESEVRVPISDATEYIQRETDLEDSESVRNEIQKRQGQVHPWRNNPTDPALVTTDTDIHTGARSILQELTDDFKIKPRAPIRYSMGGEKKPLSFHRGSNPRDDDAIREEIEGYQLPVGTQELSLDLFYRFVSVGVETRFDKNPSHNTFLQKFGSQLTSYAEEWQKNVNKRELDPAEKIFTNAGNHYDLADFTLASYGLVYLLSNPDRELTANNIAEDFSNKLSLDTDLDSYLEEEFDDDDYDHLRSLMDNSETIINLMKWKFGVISSVLDRQAIEEKLAANRPFSVLDTLGIGAISRLSSDVQFTDGTSFKSVGVDLYRVNAALRTLEARESSEPASELILQSLDGADLEEIQSTGDIIRSGYDDEIDTYLYEALGKLEQLDRDEIEEQIDNSRLAQSLKDGDKQDRIQQILIEQQLRDSEIYHVLCNLDFENIEDAEDIGAYFLQVGDFYVE